MASAAGQIAVLQLVSTPIVDRYWLKPIAKMAILVLSTIKPEHLLEPWPERVLVGGKCLTLLFGHIVFFLS